MLLDYSAVQEGQHLKTKGKPSFTAQPKFTDQSSLFSVQCGSACNTSVTLLEL